MACLIAPAHALSSSPSAARVRRSWPRLLLLTSLASCLLGAPPSARGTTIVYQDGLPDPFLGGTYTGVEDVHLRSHFNADEDNNQGALTLMQTGVDFNSHAHALLRFDVSSMVGQAASIESATVRIALHSLVDAGNHTLRRIADADTGWVEGVGINTIANPGESTWNSRNHLIAPWSGDVSVGGPDVNITHPLVGLSDVGQYVDFELVPGTVEEWLSGTNTGMWLGSADDDQVRTRWYTSERGDLSLRPQLVIEFTPIPEPSTALLLGGGLAALGLRRRRAHRV